MDDYIDLVVVRQMLIKLRQGIGRLIRSETDSGVISILDARATVGARYHDVVVDALPESQLVDSEVDIRRFLENKKSKEFFE